MRYSVGEEQNGTRIDVFIAENCGITRSQAARLIDLGAVRLNGVPPKKAGEKLLAGQTVDADIPNPEPISAEPEELPLEILYEDDDIVIVNKARGMVVHPSAGHSGGTLVNALLWHCRGSLSGIGGALRPGIVHRLDRDTTGILAVAKTDEAHVSLSRQIAQRAMERVYVAACAGAYAKGEAVLEFPIGRHPKDRKRMAVVADGRPAATVVKELASLKNATLMCCRLITGRTHQIRVHMARVGRPVLGDTVYGRGAEGFPLMLHSAFVSLTHPRSGEVMAFTCQPPPDFVAGLNRLGFEGDDVCALL